MAEQRIRIDQILPDHVKITWVRYDDSCDVAVSTISVMDAYTKDCSHFVIGPSCEYCACKSPIFIQRTPFLNYLLQLPSVE